MAGDKFGGKGQQDVESFPFPAMKYQVIGGLGGEGGGGEGKSSGIFETFNGNLGLEVCKTREVIPSDLHLVHPDGKNPSSSGMTGV